MPQYDEPLEQLQHRLPHAVPPADLGSFWENTLAEARTLHRETTLTPVDTPVRTVEINDMEFSGFAGDRIRAWLRRPADTRRPLPTVIQFCGYGGGRGLAHQNILWPLLGYAEIVVDARGQGALNGYVGDTSDPHGSDSSHPGFMTRGIGSESTSYLRRIYTDAALAVEAAAALDEVDAAKIAVSGSSQGGGLALAASALTDITSAAMINVPFLSDFPRALALASEGPYLEITGYLKSHRGALAETMRVLSYFDVALLAARSTSPALFSVALGDNTCPPSSVFAAINNYSGPAQTRIYPFNDHEGGQFHQEAEQLRWLCERFLAP